MFNKDVCVGQILIEVKIIKANSQKIYQENKKRKSKIIRMLGDNFQSRCVLIPMGEFMNLWRELEIKNKTTATK